MTDLFLLLTVFIVCFCCSIEDPFETHYDVAHVIKSAQMAYFRKELLVSYGILIALMWFTQPAVVFGKSY